MTVHGRRLPVLDRGTGCRYASSCKRLVHTCRAEVNPSGEREYQRHQQREPQHSGPGLHTPANVHHDTATQIRQQRGLVLTAAYHAHPERYVRKPPGPHALPTISWINPPTRKKPRSVITTQRRIIQVDSFRSARILVRHSSAAPV